MMFFSILTILLPFVVSMAVLPEGPTSNMDLQQCRSGCKKEFDSCRARDHRPNIQQCKILVCRLFGNDCPGCNYCAAHVVSPRDIDITVDQSSAEAVTPIVTQRGEAKSPADVDIPVTKADICSRGVKRCSNDKTHIQECVYSQVVAAWQYEDKKKCGGKCCNYITGTKTPMCMCLKPPMDLLNSEGVDDAED